METIYFIVSFKRLNNSLLFNLKKGNNADRESKLTSSLFKNT